MAYRQTVPEDAIWHELVQQSELEGSQTAPAANLHVVASQQGSSVLDPGSQSSPLGKVGCVSDGGIFAAST